MVHAEFEVNCESNGSPVASLSVAVAAATAQPPAASPAWSSSWSIPGTRTVILPPPTVTPNYVTVGQQDPSPAMSVWTSDGSVFFSASWGATYSASFGPAPAPTGSSIAFGAASGSTTTQLVIPGSSTSGSGLSEPVAAVSTPAAGSTLITFNSPVPSASDIAQPANTNNGNACSAVSLLHLAGATTFAIVAMINFV